MSTASLAASRSGAAVRIDRLFLGLALGATAMLLALVVLDHQPASAALIVGGFGLGVAFLKAEFSYTASWRRFLNAGRGRRPARRADRDRDLRARGRAGRCADAELWRGYCTARPIADSRCFRVRYWHAACQWLRVRHALHGRRRLRPHADCACCSSSSAASSAAWHCRPFSRSAGWIRSWLPTISAPGAVLRRRS